MLAESFAAASGFDADHFYCGVAEKSVEKANGVRSAANARDEMIGQTLFGEENLLARFFADDLLKIADHLRIRMRAKNRAEKIMGGADVRDPVAHCFVDGIFQRAAAGIHAYDFRAEQAHAKNIQALALHVVSAHVNGAGEAEARGNGRRRNAMLARASFRDHALLAHADGEQVPGRGNC